MKRLAILLLCLLPLPILAHAKPSDHAGDRAQIHALMGHFRAAITQKDEAAFNALFAPGTTVWQPVLGDDTLARVRKHHPKATKVRLDPHDNPHDFMAYLIAHKLAANEVYRHVHIDTDGDVAAVDFDYRFLINGHETNRGRECWQLVRTDAGWRIISVIWSIHPPQAGPRH